MENASKNKQKRKHKNYFESNQLFACKSCRSHILEQRSIISRNFQGRNGSAYLVADVQNVNIGAKEERMLLTGIHTVADILCSCNIKIGWKYLRALEEPQKYKEGKYIVEKSRVCKDFEWDD